MSINKRREIVIFNMSFLDVISCGFGAIILLLIIVKVSEPYTLEKDTVEIKKMISELTRQLSETSADNQQLMKELDLKKQQLAQIQTALGDINQEISKIRGQFKQQKLENQTQSTIQSQLVVAQQTLSEEQRRLQAQQPDKAPQSSYIGGVPVDSEYIIFIIDTSGSMQRYAWPLLIKKVDEILSIYPNVKGIQVMNDMGGYLFSQYAGRWIKDSPARRKAILKRLTSWKPFSNSSPVEGITAAIKRFYATDKKISIYVLGDDFSIGSIESVINTVNRLNQDHKGGKRVRIHAVGFPVIFKYADNPTSGIRFAALMRKLAETNDGSFVGLNSTR